MDNIQKILDYIEKEKNIKCVFVVECGSRSWGLKSPDSDHDLRGVYIDLDKIKRNKHVLFNDSKKINGISEDKLYDWDLWELSDYLRALKKNNSSAIDWLISPICYRGQNDLKLFQDTFIKSLNSHVFCYHHFGLMKSSYKKWLDPSRNNKELNDNEIITEKIKSIKHSMNISSNTNSEQLLDVINKNMNDFQYIKSLIKSKSDESFDENNINIVKNLKKILYVIRSALSVEYILQKEEIPPPDINDILKHVELTFDKTLIENLINIKKTSCKTDSFECPSWVISWVNDINEKMTNKNIKKTKEKYIELKKENKNKKVQTCQKVDNDTYINFYIEYIKNIE
jgi:predicted nucleotidyltransferase